METIDKLENGVDKLLQVVVQLREENHALKESLGKSRAGVAEEVLRLQEDLAHEKAIKEMVLVKVEELIKRLAEIEA